MPDLTSNIPALQQHAAAIRGRLVAMSHASGAPHLGSGLSCVDLLVALYWTQLRFTANDPARDRFILSKGHAAAALYATLAERGVIDPALLDTFACNGSSLPEQPTPPLGPDAVPGVEWATGSLGHGLSVGVGMAMAAKLMQLDYRVFVLLSDGECNEGTVWEAAMFAPPRKLDNLIAIVDYNRWQATDRSDEVMALAPISRKFEAFGWHSFDVDGHDLHAVTNALNIAVTHTKQHAQPTAIIAHTVKGRGVSFMEDDNNWHYRIPTAAEVAASHKELGLTA